MKYNFLFDDGSRIGGAIHKPLNENVDSYKIARAGVDEPLIMDRTGHSSVTGVRN